MTTKAPLANARTPVKEADSQTVPHVVRVTFLGVAGILASPRWPSKQSPHPKHPSLLFPEPEALRVVAAVSRTRTARGIPSGMSGCLERPKREDTSPEDGFATIGEHAHNDLDSVSEVPCGLAGVKSKLALDANVVVAPATSAASDPTPPSRLLHLRTNLHGGREGVANAAGKLDGATAMAVATTTKTRCSSFSLKLDETQGSIEITASTDGMIDPNHIHGSTRHENVESSDDANQKEIINTNEDRDKTKPAIVNGEREEPERYVAVWEQDAPRRKEVNATAPSVTNTLAFEAELHPSSRNKSPTTELKRKSLGLFAPKTFCVTVGLIPDCITEEKERDNNNSSNDSNLPTFAIPIGFANLVITGEETLDGQPLQLDLPLTSLHSFIGNFGNNTSATDLKNGQSGDFPFPLLELGNGGDTKESSQHAQEKIRVGDEQEKKLSKNVRDAPQKAKIKPTKKSVVSRIFSRTKHGTNKTTSASNNNQHTNPPDFHEVFSGQALSIFQLGRPPNAKELTLFLERYSVDPSGDAVIRIALEVFQRGSELERVFRQRNRMRREQRRKKAAASAPAAAGTESVCADVPPYAHGYVDRISSSGTCRSLIDDEDFIESDSESEESESYFSLDSERSGTTWDESTFYTYETFGSYHSRTDTSYSSELVTDRGLHAQNSVFGRIFDCKLDGVDGDSPKNNSMARKQNFPIQLQSLLNLNCAAGGSSRQSGFHEYEVPRELIPAVSSYGSAVSSSTPMDSHDAKCVSTRGGTKIGLHGVNGVVDDHSVQCVGNKIMETSVDQTSDDPSCNIDRTYTVGTVGNEESPMALIVQRAPQAVSWKNVTQSSETFQSNTHVRQSHDEAEGLELTLEESSHQKTL